MLAVLFLCCGSQQCTWGAEAVTPVSMEIPVSNSKVTDVTVFADRAEVTREVLLHFEAPGTYEVVLAGVTQHLDPGTVRVKGTGELRIAEVSVDNRLAKAPAPAPTASSEAEQLRADLAVQDEALLALRQAKKRAEDSVQLLTTYTSQRAAPSAEKGAAALTLEEMGAMLDFRDTRHAELDKQLRKIDADVRQATAQRDRLQRALSALERPERAGSSERVQRVVSCVVEATEAGAASLVLSYVVSEASWLPSYDLRVSSQDGSFGLTYFGSVRQNSGEDWSGVRLRLSTAEPVRRGSPPELGTAVVGLQHRGERQQHHHSMASFSFGAAMEEAQGVAEMDDGAPRARAAPMMRKMGAPQRRRRDAVVETATVRGSGSGPVAFEVARPADIASDGKAHRVTVAVLSLPSVSTHFAVPGITQAAYLQSLTNNTSEFPLLASDSVNVFVDGTYVGRSGMSAVSPGEQFSTYVGEDPAVRVQARPPKRYSGTSGMLLWKDNTETTERVVTVRNTKRVPVHISVLQQLPRSEHEKVQVHLKEPTPDSITKAKGLDERQLVGKWRTVLHDTESNNLAWRLVLQPGEEASLTLRYEVEWPTNEHLSVRNLH
eukprot:TRINITY_DN60273_c0_g1_i1.p1 TRINITY_DN60273_c0_g1~~TRINITY_DN60273_c0_g1_i1.p1  ORF type:complete len:635 (+),score=188.75 TRINITY_DN60273_c0_g1_i1:94-1905(+)